jgi:mxaA protein
MGYKSWILLALLSGSPLCIASPTSTPIVQQPRSFGYVLGDTMTQRILLQSPGHNFDLVSLPPTERAGLWFARRSSRIEVAEDKHRWLVIDYQLINAPQALMTVNLPSVTLKPKSGNAGLTVPEWPVSIAPLTPRAAFGKGALQELRPDHPAPMLPTQGQRRWLKAWSGALVLTLVSWLAWWLVRSLRAAATQPFAQALREIRRSDDDSNAAWLALHRAFDRTARRVLQLSTLPALFKQAPHFESERAAIERFYSESYARFFGVNAETATHMSTSVSGPTSSPRALCAVLHRIERQYEP